jgi:hypothetical protein
MSRARHAIERTNRIINLTIGPMDSFLAAILLRRMIVV